MLGSTTYIHISLYIYEIASVSLIQTRRQQLRNKKNLQIMC